MALKRQLGTCRHCNKSINTADGTNEWMHDHGRSQCILFAAPNGEKDGYIYFGGKQAI